MGWIKAATDPQSGLTIHWIRYRDLCSGMSSVITRVLKLLIPKHPAIEAPMNAKFEEVRANFVIGDDDEWRLSISKDDQGRMWESICPEIKELLELTR